MIKVDFFPRLKSTNIKKNMEWHVYASVRMYFVDGNTTKIRVIRNGGQNHDTTTMGEWVGSCISSGCHKAGSTPTLVNIVPRALGVLNLF